MFDIDKKNNRQGYRDGKQGMILRPDMAREYKKGWTKGFVKFVYLHPSIFFNSDQEITLIELSYLTRCGLSGEKAIELHQKFSKELTLCPVV